MRNLVLATAFAASLSLTAVRAEDGRPPLPPGAVVHQVVVGEDLDSLAEAYGVDLSTLRAANPQKSAADAGDLLVIPRPSEDWPTHTVRSGETLWRIGKAYGISVEQLRQANGISDSALLPGNVLRLPRAEKPAWTLPEATPASAASPGGLLVGSNNSYGTAAPTLPAQAAPRLQGTWIEVRLPDNRRAWAPVEGLVVGSWQPQAPDRVIEVGRSFVGVPYKWGGVDPNGWDCSGFMQEVFRLGGHQVPRLADAQYEACSKVNAEDLVPGDMVFFNTDGSGVSHVGIYTGNDRFLHASSSRGVVEDSLKDSYFSARYHGAGRLPAWDVVAERRTASERSPASQESTSERGFVSDDSHDQGQEEQ